MPAGENTSLTTMEVRKINKHNIYKFIYQQKNTSKQGVVDALHISLSTVAQNLKRLEKEGLIYRAGFYQSTGGRKALNFEIVKNARIAVGVDVLKDCVHIVAINLYGEIIESDTQNHKFSPDINYYEWLGKFVSQFIQQGTWEKRRLLGVGIAIQGIANADGTVVSYGPILDNAGMQLSNLAQYISYPQFLMHDSKAAALAELWCQPDITDAVVIFLNDNFGGALIKDRKVYTGYNLRGGLLEHMSIDPNGELCYCGGRGCLETICSANKLREFSQMSLEMFFEQIRIGSKRENDIWNKYLDRLAFAIRNLQVILDEPVILSGLLTSYMIEEDFDKLREKIKKYYPFTFVDDFLIRGEYGPLAPAIGSALYFVEQWLQEI